MGKVVPKKQRDKWVKDVVELVKRYGGVVAMPPERNSIDGELHAKLTLDTKFGPLEYVSVSGEASRQIGGPGDIMTRFRFASIAASSAKLGYEAVNCYSGKWNNHYIAPHTPASALEDFKGKLELIKITPVDEFTDVTSIVPRVVVETVFEQRGIVPNGVTLQDPAYAFSVGKGLHNAEAMEWFIENSVRRIIFLYDTNMWLASKMRGKGNFGRDMLFMFVHHWLDAYMDRPVDYRERKPLLHTLCKDLGP